MPFDSQQHQRKSYSQLSTTNRYLLFIFCASKLTSVARQSRQADQPESGHHSAHCSDCRMEANLKQKKHGWETEAMIAFFEKEAGNGVKSRRLRFLDGAVVKERSY